MSKFLPVYCFLFLKLALTQQCYGHTGELEEVVVIARQSQLESNKRDVSQGNYKFTPTDIFDIEWNGDLLGRIPGMATTQHSGSGKASQYYLRGFNLDHGTDFATYVDSMPVNQVSHGHGQGYTDLNFIIPELIDNLDYRKGPFYGDVGDFGGTGTAQFKSKDFLSNNLLSYSAGEYGFNRFFGAYQKGVGQGNWLFAAENQRYDGPWENLEEDVNKNNLFIKYAQGNQQTGWNVSLMHYKNRWNSSDQIPLRKVEDGTISLFEAVDPSAGGESERSSLSAQHRAHSGDHNYSTNIYVIKSSLDLWSNFTYFSRPEGDQFHQQDQRITWGGDFKWGMSRNLLPGFKNRHVFGVQLRNDDADPVGLFLSEQRENYQTVRRDQLTVRQISAYWQGLWNWTGSFSSSFHLRWNHHHFDVQAQDAQSYTSLEANTGNNNADIWTGAVQNYWQATNSFALYWHFGRSYHSNDARGVLTSIDPVSGEDVETADPLTPVHGTEIGADWQMSDAVSASLVAWVLDIDAEQIFVGDTGTTENTELKSRRKGLEALLEWQPNTAYGGNINFSLSRAEFDDAQEEQVPGALDRLASLGAWWRLYENFRVGVRWQFIGDYYLGDDINAPSAQKLNLSANYGFLENWSMNFSVLNATNNEDYEVAYLYESRWLDESEDTQDLHIHPFSPRQFRVSLNYAF